MVVGSGLGRILADALYMSASVNLFCEAVFSTASVNKTTVFVNLFCEVVFLTTSVNKNDHLG